MELLGKSGFNAHDNMQRVCQHVGMSGKKTLSVSLFCKNNVQQCWWFLGPPSYAALKYAWLFFCEIAIWYNCCVGFHFHKTNNGNYWNRFRIFASKVKPFQKNASLYSDIQQMFSWIWIQFESSLKIDFKPKPGCF